MCTMFFFDRFSKQTNLFVDLFLVLTILLMTRLILIMYSALNKLSKKKLIKNETDKYIIYCAQFTPKVISLLSWVSFSFPAISGKQYHFLAFLPIFLLTTHFQLWTFHTEVTVAIKCTEFPIPCSYHHGMAVDFPIFYKSGLDACK